MRKSIEILLLFGWCLVVGAASAQTKVRFGWINDGVPAWDICSPEHMPPCRVNFAIRDETSGKILATLPMLVEAGKPVPTWMKPVPYYDAKIPTTSRTHLFSLAVNAQDSTAAIVQFPKAFTISKLH